MMAHWAELDENNIVLRVLVGDNNDPAGDEGYQWLIDNLGGTWLKTSYNTINNKHTLGETPFRGNFAGIGSIYIPEKDIFIQPNPHNGWVIDDAIADWVPPFPKPDSGAWVWDDATANWVEYNGA
jgi:hypothetical protein